MHSNYPTVTLSLLRVHSLISTAKCYSFSLPRRFRVKVIKTATNPLGASFSPLLSLFSFLPLHVGFTIHKKYLIAKNYHYVHHKKVSLPHFTKIFLYIFIGWWRLVTFKLFPCSTLFQCVFSIHVHEYCNAPPPQPSSSSS